MKFGTLTQIGPLQGTEHQSFHFFKKYGGGRNLQKPHKS